MGVLDHEGRENRNAKLRQWVWDERVHNYRNEATGQFLARATILRYVEESLAGSGAAAETLAGLLDDGLLNARDWVGAFREEIKREYVRQYVLGRGGIGQMSQADWGSVGGMIGEQYKYLEGFADAVASGELTAAQIRARMKMYVNSAREAFERANARAIMGREPELPAYPGDGSTVCLTNCQCHWEIVEVIDEAGALLGWNCFWRLGPSEHCDECSARSRDWNPLFVEA